MSRLASSVTWLVVVIGVLSPQRALAAEPMLDRLLIIAPAAPGGGWDQTARVLQQVLQAEGLVRVVEVQNVPGAAGTIGLAQFIDTQRGNAHALIISGLVMLGATLWNHSPVTLDQTTPVARLTGEYEIIAVPASSSHRDLRSLIEAFQKRAEAVSWGGGSAGGTDHILAGLIAESVHVDPRRVNYIAFSGGGEAVAALLGGNVTAGISGYSEFAPHVESGRLRVLGISSSSRLPGVDARTLTEQGLDVELVNWRAVLAPPGISREDQERVTALIARAVKTARWQKILADREWADMYLDGDAFARYLETERLRLAPVVARLSGPVTPAPIAIGQTIFPIAVFAGAAGVIVTLVIQSRRHRLAPPIGRPPNHRGFASMLGGLIAFVLLLQPLGFVPAATLLFVFAASGFGASVVRSAVIGAILCIIVYVAFTRGLHLTLPAGTLWAWMR